MVVCGLEVALNPPGYLLERIAELDVLGVGPHFAERMPVRFQRIRIISETRVERHQMATKFEKLLDAADMHSICHDPHAPTMAEYDIILTERETTGHHRPRRSVRSGPMLGGDRRPPLPCLARHVTPADSGEQGTAGLILPTAGVVVGSRRTGARAAVIAGSSVWAGRRISYRRLLAPSTEQVDNDLPSSKLLKPAASRPPIVRQRDGEKGVGREAELLDRVVVRGEAGGGTAVSFDEGAV